MKALFYKSIERWLNKKGITLILKKDLDDLLASVGIEKPIIYQHWKYNTKMDMDYSDGYWTVIYTMEQQRSKDTEEFETVQYSFKAIDKNLDDAVRTVHKAGDSLLNGLAELGKNLFDLEE